MSLVPYDSSGSENEIDTYNERYSERKKSLKQPIKIHILPLSQYDEKEGKETGNIAFKKLNTGNLLSILPRPKHKTSNKFLLTPRIAAKVHRKTTVHRGEQRNDDLDNKRGIKVLLSKPSSSNKSFKSSQLDIQTPETLATDCASERNIDCRTFLMQSQIHAADMTGSSHEFNRNRTKSLTDPEKLPKPYVKQVNITCRKKNHISYLVQKVKESEQELKNQWAASKFTRQQTRAKYGF